jgi:hypothetical protein
MSFFSGSRTSKARDARECFATMKGHLSAMKAAKANGQASHNTGNLADTNKHEGTVKLEFAEVSATKIEILTMVSEFTQVSPKRSASSSSAPLEAPVYPLTGPPVTPKDFSDLEEFSKAHKAFLKSSNKKKAGAAPT